jgi:hypothetical protein
VIRHYASRQTSWAVTEKLKIVIPELLVENGLLPAGTDNVPFAIKAERSELAPVA